MINRKVKQSHIALKKNEKLNSIKKTSCLRNSIDKIKSINQNSINNRNSSTKDAETSTTNKLNNFSENSPYIQPNINNLKNELN